MGEVFTIVRMGWWIIMQVRYTANNIGPPEEGERRRSFKPSGTIYGIIITIMA